MNPKSGINKVLRCFLRYSGNLGEFLINKIAEIFFSGESGNWMMEDPR